MRFPCLTISLLLLLQGNEYDQSGQDAFSNTVFSLMQYLYTKWQVNATPNPKDQ
jgi:hypothetical protein